MMKFWKFKVEFEGDGGVEAVEVAASVIHQSVAELYTENKKTSFLLN
jgi:hypothetical protein